VRSTRRKTKTFLHGVEIREAIETIPAMAWIAGPDGAIQFRNRRVVEYTGLSQSP
jgi:PAS domain-containing protein